LCSSEARVRYDETVTRHGEDATNGWTEFPWPAAAATDIADELATGPINRNMLCARIKDGNRTTLQGNDIINRSKNSWARASNAQVWY
jgi:hypothetical protein